MGISPFTGFIQTTPITITTMPDNCCCVSGQCCTSGQCCSGGNCCAEGNCCSCSAVNVVHLEARVDVQTVDVAAAAVLEDVAQINKTKTQTYIKILLQENI